MAKSGQARVIDSDEVFRKLIDEIEKHRYPEKNKAIIMVSFKLGLRAQEIALLQLKEVARLVPAAVSGDGFVLNEIMPLPAKYTKGANATRDPSTKQRAKVMSFQREAFDRIVSQIVERVQNGLEVNASDYYPAARKSSGKSRDLPMVDPELRAALTDYLRWRLNKIPHSQKSDPLFISQKTGKAYSANTMQLHIGKILKEWAGIERASSHSGRRSLLTKIIRKTGDLKAAQKVAGHLQPSTTLIYTEATETDIANAMLGVRRTPDSR